MDGINAVSIPTSSTYLFFCSGGWGHHVSKLCLSLAIMSSPITITVDELACALDNWTNPNRLSGIAL